MLTKNMSEAWSSARRKIGNLSMSGIADFIDSPEASTAYQSVLIPKVEDLLKANPVELKEKFATATGYALSKLVSQEKYSNVERLVLDLHEISYKRLVYAVTTRDYESFLQAHSALVVVTFLHQALNLGELNDTFESFEKVLLTAANDGGAKEQERANELIKAITSFEGSLGSFWGNKAVKRGRLLSNFPFPLDFYFANLHAASPEGVTLVAGKVAQTAMAEIDRCDDSGYARIVDLDRVFDEQISLMPDAHVREQAKAALDPWHKVLSLLPVSYIEQLSVQGAFYALRIFVDSEFNGRWPETLEKIIFFVDKAEEKSNPRLAVSVLNRSLLLAQSAGPDIYYHHSKDVAERISAIYQNGNPELVVFLLKAIRKYAGSRINKGDLAAGWEILYNIKAIPLEHIADGKAHAAYAAACVDLANLCQKANQPEAQITWITEAMEHYKSAGMHKQVSQLASMLSALG